MFHLLKVSCRHLRRILKSGKTEIALLLDLGQVEDLLLECSIMPLRKYLPASQRDHDFGTRLVKSFTALLVDFSAPRQSQLAIDCRNHKLGGPDGPLEFEEGFRRDKGADVTRMLPAWTEDDLTEQMSLLTGMKSDKTQASHLPLVRHKFLLYGNNPTDRCLQKIHTPTLSHPLSRIQPPTSNLRICHT
jgi:hypothetical protein